MTQRIDRILIAGGGTGGHIYPGVAIAEEILNRNPKAEVQFIGTAQGLEAKILPKLGYPLNEITASRLKGGGILAKLKGLFRLPIGIFQSWRIFRRFRPQIVLGVGGYASGPALLAAWLTRRPRVIQEQNATPGMTNAWLGKRVHHVYAGFEAARAHFPADKITISGNPIRQQILARLDSAQAPPAAHPSAAGPRLRLLIFGGSQGARFLNTHLPPLLAALHKETELTLEIVHQTGVHDESQTRTLYAELGLEARVLPYIDDMAQAYANADLAICRAGALTLAELMASGLPSILIPLPTAANNHQEANARDLEARGAARVWLQPQWDEAQALADLKSLATDPAQLHAMAAKVRPETGPQAAQRIVDGLESLLFHSKGGP